MPYQAPVPTGVDHDEALAFFASYFDPDELHPDLRDTNDHLYVASILAHHSQVPIGSGDGTPLPSDLSGFFDLTLPYIMGEESRFYLRDVEFVENLASIALLFNGFYRGHRDGRYNVRFFDGIAQRLYLRAAEHTLPSQTKKKSLFFRMAYFTSFWTFTISRAQRQMKDDSDDLRYLIKLPPMGGES